MGYERRTQLIVFDMDGVLVDIESSWGWIHDHLGINNEETVKSYIRGEITDLDFMRNDIALWKQKGVGETQLKEILREIPLMHGVHRCLDTLNQYPVSTAIVSAGLDILANRIAQDLQIDYVIANGIEIKKGVLTGRGFLRVSPKKKDVPIKQLSHRLQIPFTDIVSVGNSHFDIRMFQISGLGIAFNPLDNQTEKAADIIITEKDLSLILPHVGIPS